MIRGHVQDLHRTTLVKSRLERIDEREITRLGRSGKVDIARAVHRQGGGPVHTCSTEVGGINQVRTRRIELGHEGIAAACESVLDAIGGWEVDGGRGACDIDVARGIHGDSAGVGPASASQVGGVNQNRVDHEGLARIVGADGKAHFVRPFA